MTGLGIAASASFVMIWPAYFWVVFVALPLWFLALHWSMGCYAKNMPEDSLRNLLVSMDISTLRGAFEFELLWWLASTEGRAHLEGYWMSEAVQKAVPSLSPARRM